VEEGGCTVPVCVTVTMTGDRTGEVLMLSGMGARRNCLAKEVDCGEDGAEVGVMEGVCFTSAGFIGSVGSGSVKACIKASVGGLVS
jgi:hypothetical protein